MLGSGDAPFDSDRSLLRIIHENLLSSNPPTRGPSEPGPRRPAPPIPPNKPIHTPTHPPVPPKWSPAPPTRAPHQSPNSPSNSQPWDPTKHYALGDLVTYQGHGYQCITAHQGQVDWIPTAAVSLWKLVS